MGFEEDMMYWNEVKDSLSMTITSSESRILSICKLLEKKEDEEEEMREYKYRGEQAVQAGNAELAAACHLLVKGPTNINLQLAVWCFVKASRPDQVLSTIWTAAARHFMKLTTPGDYEQFSKNETIAYRLAELAKAAEMEIRILDADFWSFLHKARVASHFAPELAVVWNEAAIHFQKNAKYLKSAMIIGSNDYGDIQKKVNELTMKVNKDNHSFLSVLDHSCTHLEYTAYLSEFALKLIEYGYPETSKIFLEQIRIYREEILRFFQETEMKSRSCWEAGLEKTNHTRGTDFISLHEYFERWKFYLEKIIVYTRNDYLYDELVNLVNLSDSQIVKFFSVFAHRYSNCDLIPAQVPLGSLIIKDYSKAIDYSREILKSERDGEEETAQFYRKMLGYRQASAEWRELLFEKLSNANAADWKENLDDAIETIAAAEAIIQNTIVTKSNISESIDAAEKLQQAANLFILAAKQNDRRKVKYRKAGEALKTGVESECDKYFSISDQFLRAAELFARNERRDAYLVAHKATLFERVLNESTPPEEANRIHQLLEIGNHPNMVNPVALEYWKKMHGLAIPIETPNFSKLTSFRSRFTKASDTLNLWKEEAFSYSMEALWARLEGDETRFAVWDKIVEELRKGIEVKVNEANFAAKGEMTNWEKFHQSGKQIRTQIDDLYAQAKIFSPPSHPYH